MAKRKIPVSNKQVDETKFINSLNSNLLKKKEENTNSIKEKFPDVEKNVDSFVDTLEGTLAETKNEPVINTPQDVLDGLNTEAVDAYNCGTEIVEDNAPNSDKTGYANADPSPMMNDTMTFKELSPEAIEKLKNVILPEAESILKRFNNLENALKDNEDSRKAVNSEVSHKNFDDWISSSNLTDYGKKVFEAGRKVGRFVTEKDTAYEMVNHPSHYNQYDIEVIDMIIKIWGPEAAALWCDITAFKYRMRMGTKPNNSIEQDIKKEQWYLNKSKEIRKNLNK